MNNCSMALDVARTARDILEQMVFVMNTQS